MAIFTRNSVAYDSNGNQVTANVPRFSCNGLFVEEGTTNLIPSTKQTFVTGFTAYTGEGITVTDYDVYIPELGKTVTAKRITGDGKGTSTYKYFTSIYNYAIGNIITTSIYGMVLSRNAHLVSNIAGNTIYFNNTMQRLSATSNAATMSATTQLSFVTNNATDVLDIVVYRPQQELKSYATSFADATRAAETLTIPANTLNTTEGTIERTFTPLITGIQRYLFDAGGADGSNISIWIDSSNILHAKIGSYTLDGTTALTDACKIAFAYDKTGATLYVNGASIATVTFTTAPTLAFGTVLHDGSKSDATTQQNGYTEYLRYSKTRHSDSKILTDSQQILTVEADTTYYMPLIENIGAQASPISKIFGIGNILTSRIGTGTRQANIIGISKFVVDNIRKSYVSVIIKTLAKLVTSRQGTGARQTNINGLGSIKVIEPLITADLNVQERKGETEVVGVPLVGNTVRITAKFHSFSGTLADPEGIKLTFYDFSNKQIGDSVPITAANRISAGVYSYDYVIPSGYKRIYYQFIGQQEKEPMIVGDRTDCLTAQEYNVRYR